MSNICFGFVESRVWVVKENERGNYDCESPRKHKDSPDYSMFKSSWRNCEIVALNDEAYQMLGESVGKVVTLKGSYVFDRNGSPKNVALPRRYYTKEVLK